jgi:hypothetical protein
VEESFMSDSLDLSKPLAPPAGVPATPGVAGSAGSALELSPPAAVPVIPDEQVDSMVPIDEATRADLRNKAAAFVEDLATQDPQSPAFQDKVADITKMGEREIVASARVSNRMLDRPAQARTLWWSCGTPSPSSTRRRPTSRAPASCSA